MRRGAGFLPIVGAVAALIVWAAHFLAIYGVQATACARGAEAMVRLVPWIVLGLTAAALLLVAAIGLRAWRRLPYGLAGQDPDDEPRFTDWMATAGALLATLAILWQALPALLLPTCG
jgi:hypothetical protein